MKTVAVIGGVAAVGATAYWWFEKRNKGAATVQQTAPTANTTAQTAPSPVQSTSFRTSRE